MLQRMENIREPVPGQRDYSIPRLFTLRRVAERYQQVLPLSVMRRYQCVVIGGEDDALTIAIVDERSTDIFGIIRMLTGKEIFPVLIEPARMQLLLRRIERNECSAQNRQHYLPRPYSVDLFPQDVHEILLLLTS